MKKLVFYGCGGFGREVAWQTQQVNDLSLEYDLVGFVDDMAELWGTTLNGLPVLGGRDYLLEMQEDIYVVLCIGNAKIRKMNAEILSKYPHVHFPTIIAKNVELSPSVKLGKGCIVCLSNILTVNIEIGDFVIINLDCTVGHDVILDEFVTVYPSVNISGNVHVGSCAEIGTGAQIIQGKNIGNNSIIGAGSVVVKNIPSDCTAVGAPATPIKFHKV